MPIFSQFGEIVGQRIFNIVRILQTIVLNYFLLEAGDEFKCQKRQFHGTFNLYDRDI